MKHIEIELRFKILKPKQLPLFLAKFEHLHHKHDIDIYLDTPQATLYQRGIFIRLRNENTLDIKFNRACLDNPKLAIQDYCEEHSFSLPLQNADLNKINNLLLSLNLQPVEKANLDWLKKANNLDTHYIVDKKRASYTFNDFTIAIDEVADLGTFIEAEHMTSTIDKIEETKQKMTELLSELSLEPLKTGYGTLLLRKKNFQHYLLGRFILESDRALN